MNRATYFAFGFAAAWFLFNRQAQAATPSVADQAPTNGLQGPEKPPCEPGYFLDEAGQCQPGPAQAALLRGNIAIA